MRTFQLMLISLVVCSYSLADLDKVKKQDLTPVPNQEDPYTNHPYAAPSTKNSSEVVEIEPYVKEIDVFGTNKLTAKGLRKRYGKELDGWFKEGLQGNEKLALKKQAELSEKIKKDYGFAHVDWSILEYFEPGDLALRVTLDIVERKDRKKRMPFRKNKKRKIPDPGNLLRSWNTYVMVAMDIAEKGGLDPYETKCKEAFHCLFGHSHQNLKEFGKMFEDGVKLYHKELLEILKSHRDPQDRANAAFLLAYHNDGKHVVKWMIEGVYDPHPLVRNNALRVLGDIAELHPELNIPLKPVLTALNYPMVTDRSKAIYALFAMIENSKMLRKQVVNRGSDYLVTLLQSKQPNESEAAHAVLKKVSGKNFPHTDVAAWKRWASSQLRGQASN